MKLYLDDWRTPPRGDGYASADNYADFLALVDKYRNCLELVDLDYDLGYDSLFNGYHALKYMKAHDIRPQHINIHSTHMSGRDKMLKYAITNFPDAVVTGWASDY
jgi:hypothetical protein